MRSRTRRTPLNDEFLREQRPDFQLLFSRRTRSGPTPLRRNPFRLSQLKPLRDHVVGCLIGLLLIACIAFGGATRNGGFSDVVLQLLSVPLLILATFELAARSGALRVRWHLIFIAMVVLLPACQLLPLPLSIWRLLPGRSLISETYDLIGQPQPASPITMTPNATWLSVLTLLPPISLFLGVLILGRRGRRAAAFIIVAGGLANAFLGLLQFAQGPHSALRFYEITNRMEAVGFFANRNHFAAILYVATLFIAARCFESFITYGQSARNHRADINRLLPLIAWLTAMIIVIAGELMARSRAGLLLMAFAILISLGLGAGDRRMTTIRPGLGKAVVLLTAGSLIFFAPLALSRILDRLGSDTTGEMRMSFARNTVSAALSYMPLGSGVGSFVPVYQLFEKTSDVAFTYANHAHNDLLEIWLETGVPGLLLVAALVAWILSHTISLWRPIRPRDMGEDTSLRRAASAALALLLMHSLVDYPLRTTALMAVFAVCAALLIDPVPRPPRERASLS